MKSDPRHIEMKDPVGDQVKEHIAFESQRLSYLLKDPAERAEWERLAHKVWKKSQKKD